MPQPHKQKFLVILQTARVYHVSQEAEVKTKQEFDCIILDLISYGHRSSDKLSLLRKILFNESIKYFLRQFAHVALKNAGINKQFSSKF